MTSAPDLNAEVHDAIDRSDEAFSSVDWFGRDVHGLSRYAVLVEATEATARRGDTLVIRNRSRYWSA